MDDMEVTDSDLDFGGNPAPRQTTKRSRRGGKVTETTITKRELNDDSEEEGSSKLTFAALFDPGPDDANQETVVRVRVFRADPREGYLGYIEDLDATEAFIKEQWGGSVYKLEGLNNRGRIIRVRTVVIGGDPIFIGEAFETSWRKQKGLPARRADGGTGEQLSTKDMLALIQAREEALRKELADKEERDRKERQEREAERRREEREWQAQREREQREWDERRRRDQEEADRRRRQEEEAREDRRRRDAEEAAARQQQHMTQMLSIVQAQANNMIAFVKETVVAQAAGPKGADPSEMLIKGVQLALQLKEAAGGEGEEDLLTTVVKNLPQMLNSAGNAVGKAIREVKGGGAAPPIAPGGPKLGITPQGGLMLPPGPVSEKFAAIVNRVVEAGGDPEQALASVADKLLTGGKGTPKPASGGKTPVVFDPGPPAPAAESAAPSTSEAPAPPSDNPQPVHKPAAEGVKRMKFTK
jgi:hypothetical protein